MERTILQIILSKTPNLNNIYGHTFNGHMYLKNWAKEWKEETILTIRSLGHDQYLGKVSLLVHLYTCKHQDADSILKLLMDTLQASEIIADDYQIFDLRVIKHECKKGDEKVDVTLKEYYA